MKTSVVIPAAGQGNRMGAGMNKLFIPIAGKPILIHTVELFILHPWIDDIVLVVAKNDRETVDSLLKKYHIQDVKCVAGGRERQHSVFLGLMELKEAETVLVHDGARPFTPMRDINRLLEIIETEDAALLAVPVKDTIKKVNREGFIEDTPSRESLWAAQTPQAFRLPVLLEAHKKAETEGYIGTDDASLVEHLGYRVKVIPGSSENIKLTTPDDLFMGERILEKKRGTKL